MSTAAALLDGRSIVDSIGEPPPGVVRAGIEWYQDRALRRLTQQHPESRPAPHGGAGPDTSTTDRTS